MRKTAKQWREDAVKKKKTKAIKWVSPVKQTLKEKKEEEKRQKMMYKYYAQQYKLKISNEIKKALKAQKVPDTLENGAMVARYLKRAIQLGFQLTAREAVALVKNDIAISKKMKLVKKPNIEGVKLNKAGLKKLLKEVREYAKMAWGI